MRITTSSITLAWVVALATACGSPESATDAGGMDGGVGPDGFVATPDAGPPERCTSNADCDDAVECTYDTCHAETGVCRNVLATDLCAAGESCHPMRGCEPGGACSTDADCADADACTTDERCDELTGRCAFEPLDVDSDERPPPECGGIDCDDSTWGSYPGAPELPDDRDNDCDGRVDEDLHAGLAEYCRQYDERCGPFGQCYFNVTHILDTLGCGNASTIADVIALCATRPCDTISSCLWDALGACDCAAPSTFCEGSRGVGTGCYDLVNGPYNCGSCGSTCPDGATCAEGGCRCADGRTACAGIGCVDTSSDPANCGTCGNVCPAGTTCADGVCGCPSGATLCADRCVDLSSDVEHCGSCDRACTFSPRGPREACVDGACVPCGDAGEPCCGASGSECFDWSTCGPDDRCVACGRVGEPCCAGVACEVDLVCGTDGRCACPPATPDPCGSTCVDLSSDLANCGACGTACPVGASCGAGTCACPGAVGRDCGGVCVDVDSDPANCGACGAPCGASEACVGGSCRAVFETTVTANRFSMLRKEGTPWSSVRSATAADAYVDATGGGQVFSYYSGFWGRYFNHRVGVRFARPSLPAGATVVGASLTMRPSDVQQPGVIDALYVTSFTPFTPDRSVASDYSMRNWGATGSRISALALVPETPTTVSVPGEAVTSFTSTSSYWFVGIRTAPDVSGGTPLSTDPAAPATPRVAFDELTDVVLTVRYVM